MVAKVMRNRGSGPHDERDTSLDQRPIHAENRDGDATSRHHMAVVIVDRRGNAPHLGMVFLLGDGISVRGDVCEDLAQALGVGDGFRRLRGEGAGEDAIGHVRVEGEQGPTGRGAPGRIQSADVGLDADRARTFHLADIDDAARGIENGQMHRFVRGLHQDIEIALGHFDDVVVAQGRDTQSPHLQRQPVKPGLGVLLDETDMDQGGEDAVDAAFRPLGGLDDGAQRQGAGPPAENFQDVERPRDRSDQAVAVARRGISMHRKAKKFCNAEQLHLARRRYISIEKMRRRKTIFCSTMQNSLTARSKPGKLA